MNGIDRLASIPPIGNPAATPADARSLARAAISEIAGRAQAWSALLAGSDPGSGPAFRPDLGELARGGDVYGLRSLVDQLAGSLGATPAEQGELLRAAEGLTREIAVQVHGLAGADPDVQLAGTRDAIETAIGADAPEGVEGLISRLEAATTTLAAQRG